jgi:hypothetical protein
LKIKANLILPDTGELMKSVGLNEGGKVQKYIDGFIFDHSEPYLPGYHLYRDSKNANKPGNGEVIWNTPDANYLYESKLMVDPITLKGAFFNPNYGFWSRPNTQKIMDPQGRNLTYHGGGQRGSHWFDRMIDNEMYKLLEGIQNIVNGGKNE